MRKSIVLMSSPVIKVEDAGVAKCWSDEEKKVGFAQVKLKVAGAVCQSKAREQSYCSSGGVQA